MSDVLADLATGLLISLTYWCGRWHERHIARREGWRA